MGDGDIWSKVKKAVSTFICSSRTGLPSEALDSHLLLCVSISSNLLNLKGFQHARSQTEISSKYESQTSEPDRALNTSGDQNQTLPLPKGLAIYQAWNRSKVGGRASSGMARALLQPLAAGEWTLSSTKQCHVAPSLSNSLISLLQLQRRCQEEGLSQE